MIRILELCCSLRTPHMEHISLSDPLIGDVKYEWGVEKF